MRRLLNTLFVTTQGAYLHRDGEAVSVKQDQEVLLHVPIHTLQGIACFGRVSMSPPLMGFCAERGVAVSFLTEQGQFLVRVQGPVAGNVLLRREQYRAADDAQRCAAITQSIVMAKISNCRGVLLRAARDGKRSSKPLSSAAHDLGLALERLLANEAPVERLRGIEGECAARYFGVFNDMISSNQPAFHFERRSRRPPLDPVNALLSFAYTLLVHELTWALETVGLDPYVGFLHADRPGRPSLALDLMEEFRPILADRLVLSLINRAQVKPSGFEISPGGGCQMDKPTRRELLTLWQKRKQEEAVHPFVQESAPWGIFPYLQVLLLARHLRGDLDAYPALVWK